MKVMKYFAVASLALFAACNNEENLVVPEGANQPVDVMMSERCPVPVHVPPWAICRTLPTMVIRQRLKNCMCTC